jgi:hypothetical protein
MKTTEGAIVHLVGEQITFNERSRQRCLWCGALVDEKDWTRTSIAISPGQTVAEARESMCATKWAEFVGVDGNMRYAVEHEGDKVPEGSCMLLDPEVTA